MTQPSDIDALTYEQAREELVEVVRRLEAGATSLEDALALWERGEALAARCQAWLDGARRRLEDARGQAGASPRAPGDRPGPTPADLTEEETA
ncbi:exodeoxyribonuclease VII small subunit [Georgenia faecalis]|uniref:Exodeoxyribonuclease 7 small subunit n=1 Tax=Georgenia faecalis TaxID=2483799 RepID=A0ABV9D7P1_9MICO|nr:exodeoxyribonuclease VII small subunit [Georgenia faecalis]